MSLIMLLGGSVPSLLAASPGKLPEFCHRLRVMDIDESDLIQLFEMLLGSCKLQFKFRLGGTYRELSRAWGYLLRDIKQI